MLYAVFSPPDCFVGIIENLEREDQANRDIAGRATMALKQAKKAIFGLQRRNDVDDARHNLAQAADILMRLQVDYGSQRARSTNAGWKVAIEEYLEAAFFLRWFQGEPLTGLDDDFLAVELDGARARLLLEDDEIFGALSDLTGEMARQMQMWIVASRYDEAMRAHASISEVCELLNQNNSSGDLRRKVEQANRNLQHADARLTDLHMRSLI